MLTLESQIEAILFFSGEPFLKTKLAEILDKNLDEVDEALDKLKIQLEDRGVILIFNDNKVSLGTSPEASDIIESIKKEELTKDLSKASLETLSIVLYKGPITRAQIDYIRGVSSTFVLRNLHIRGLIEKVENPNDLRSYLYKISTNSLLFLGISKVEDLPDYNEIRDEVKDIA